MWLSGLLWGIPKVKYHFVSSNPYFPYYFYLAVKSLLCTQRQPEITIWTWRPPPPENEYWQSLLKDDRIIIKPIEREELPYFKDVREEGRGPAPYIADVVGYMKLYEYGGIYLDLDILAIRDISYLLKRDAFLVRQFLGYETVEHFMFMAKPHSKTIQLALDYSLKKIQKGGGDPGWGGTGPEAITWAIKNSDEEIDVCEDFTMFLPFYWGNLTPYEEMVAVVDPRVQSEPNSELPLNTHLIHLWSHCQDEFDRKPVLKKIMPEWIESSSSLYARLVRRIIPKAERL